MLLERSCLYVYFSYKYNLRKSSSFCKKRYRLMPTVGEVPVKIIRMNKIIRFLCLSLVCFAFIGCDKKYPVYTELKIYDSCLSDEEVRTVWRIISSAKTKEFAFPIVRILFFVIKPIRAKIIFFRCI